MILQAGGRTKAILVAATGLLLLASPRNFLERGEADWVGSSETGRRIESFISEVR